MRATGRRATGWGRMGSWAILLAWLVMMGVLVWREYFSPETEVPLMDAEAVEIQDRTEWMGIYADGQKVGFAKTQILTEDEGYRIEERATFRLNLLGVPKELKTAMDLKTDRAFRLASFALHLGSGPVRFDMDGEVRGQSLRLEIRSAGRTRKREIRLQDIPWLTQNLRYLLIQKPLKVGRRFTVPLFDPLTLASRPLVIEVAGRERWTVHGKKVTVYRLHYAWNGLQSRAWVSAAGETLKEEGLGGFSLVRETPEEALMRGWPSGQSGDLLRSTAVPVEASLPSPRNLAYMKIRLSGVDLKPFSFHDQRQRTEADTIEVHREDLKSVKSYALPHPATEEWRRALAATPLIQTDDPQIRNLADRIVEGERDARRAAERIMRWVYEHLDKIPTVSVPSAVEVLRTGQGDCNEHAVLFAALARAAGIPTKIVAGLLYQGGSFYYHAWNEVYLGGWFSIDPLLGQFPADATHVKLLEGEMTEQIRLVSLVGAVTADILDYR